MQKLEKIFRSKDPEFVAVYGRRRVGKTHLIREFFSDKKCRLFRSTGRKNGSLETHLTNFRTEIENTFYRANGMSTKLADFKSWDDALNMLTDAIKNFTQPKETIVLFLDEVPWMATQKSGFIEALDYIWNRHWSEDGRIKLVICGSAASWIIDNILDDTGGLHNRVTLRLPIAPFSLHETQLYLKHHHIRYNEDQIITTYMCLGGIPYYLKLMDKKLSAVQNITALCLTPQGGLYNEFEVLFKSLFKNAEHHEALMKLIATKKTGLSRVDIESSLNFKGGRLTKRLKELEEAGFIASFLPWGKERGLHYRVIDEFSWFMLKWVLPKKTTKLFANLDATQWESMSQSPGWQAWSGYAFEALCFKHLPQIMKALDIPAGSIPGTWSTKGTDKLNGCQIDLLFDRPDNLIMLVEIKYTESPFVIDKAYAKKLLERERTFVEMTGTEKQIFHAVISCNGLKPNAYADEVVNAVMTKKDLFSK